ncbi:MAG TPA: HAD family phosphatase [Nitrososphaera sp.]|nr:HAD family phosphatase [Nitrososphaera sp.]
MDGIIFDLDGVLVDSMPTHFRAWKEAFASIAGLQVTEREIYLLEGMRGIELVEKIFEQRHFFDRSSARRVLDEKSRIFKLIRSSKAFEGVRGMINDIKCIKTVVSGSAKEDVETILEEEFGKDKFDAVITADDVERGKPNPSAFLEALERVKVRPENAVVVENSPLGAKAANNAGIPCYVVLNNTPLDRSDFAAVIPEDRIFERTSDLREVLCK